MKRLIAVGMCLLTAACATQRFGRATPLSETEKQEFTCKDIKLDIARTQEFLMNVKMSRHDTNGAHVLGFLGDFGIGNVMEGDAAELSGETRLKQLQDLKAQKQCESET